MKKTYCTIILFCLATTLAALPGAAEAQNQTTRTTTESTNYPADGTRLMMPYQSYAQYAFDLTLRYQNEFVGSALDPDEYVVGPGDQFTVSFVSTDIPNIVGQVNLGGALFIKSAGAVDLRQMTLGEALTAIQQTVSSKYKGTEFTVEMTGFRFVPVHVVGEVVSPGIYYAPALWRASEVIELAGGLTANALSREIVLSGEGKELPVDLIRFNAVGDRNVNPMVCAGNTISIPNRKECADFVTVSGLVNRPGVFAALNGDKIVDYLTYAGGAAGSLDEMTIIVTNPGNGDPIILDGAQTAELNRVPEAGDNITVRWKDGPNHRGDVLIFGAVANPGRYPMTADDFTFADLLNACGGFTADGSTDLVQIYRSRRRKATAMTATAAYNGQTGAGENGSSGSSRTRLSLDPRRPVDLSELKLVNDDSVYVPFATGMITVTGAVVSPGLVHYHAGQSVDYYLKAAGGLGFDADRSRMVVYNPETGGEIGAAAAGQLFDGEILYVPRKEISEKP